MPINCVTILRMLLVVAGITAAAVQPGRAQDKSAEVASVIAVRGEVQAFGPDKRFRELAMKGPIYVDDTIDTGENGRIQILFTDNTIISLGRKSIVKVADYQFNGDKTGRLKTNVSEGVFRVMGGILTKTSPQEFSTETPSGNIGIRGSMYAGKVAGEQVSVVFEGGTGITLSNDTGSVSITEPGQGATASGFALPISAPFTFSADALQAIHSELTPAGFGTDVNAPASSQRLQVSPSFVAADVDRQATAVPQGEAGAATGAATEAAAPEGGEAAPADADKTGATADQENLKAITDMVRQNQEEALPALQKALNDGVVVEQALGAVLQGMKNPSRESFDTLMNEAINRGITADEARGIADRLKASGVCR